VWAEALNPRGLSQGDILRDVPVGAAWAPLVFLGKDAWTRHGTTKVYYPRRDVFEQFSAGDPSGLYIAKGRVCRALVITHNCDLDDAGDTERILVAPIWPLSFIADPADRQRIRNGERRTYVSLRDVPGVGDCYAELRSIAPVDRRFFAAPQRECSMTDEALVLLRMQLIDYFTRLDPASLKDGLSTGLAEENKA